MTSDTISTDTSEAPKRVIGGLDAFAVVAGSMLGVGIFVYVSNIAAGMGSLPLFFGMLLLGGLFAYAGSVACGELGAMMPKAGGDYVFQRAAFGPSVSFASGWVLFAAIFAGSNAALAIALFHYDIGPLLGIDMKAAIVSWPVKLPEHGIDIVINGTDISYGHLGGIALIVVLTAINDLGTSLSARTQTILTLLPIAAMVLIGLYICLVRPDVVNPPSTAELKPMTIAGVAGAFLATNFIFSGWINIIYVAAEVKDPGKNIPRSMTSATLVVTSLYIFVAGVFVLVLGLDGVAGLGWTDAGTAVATSLSGKGLVPVALTLITIAILTSINGTILGAARVGYAMSKAGAFWKPVGHLSGARKSPSRALWLGAALAILIMLSGTTDGIVEMTSLAMFVTGSLTVAALFVLRKKMPDAPRPYRAALYPWLPGLYLVLALLAIACKLGLAISDKKGIDAWYSLIGLGIFGLMLIVHLALTNRWKSALAVLVGFVLGGAVFQSLTSPSNEAYAATQNVHVESDPQP